jgi:hypothetical protein
VTNANEGDYNQNGIVDTADYIVWRMTLGTSVLNGTGADGSGNGVVDQADHDVWKSHFGELMAIGSGSRADTAATSTEVTPLTSETTSVSSPILVESSAADPILPSSTAELRLGTVDAPNKVDSADRAAQATSTANVTALSGTKAERPPWSLKSSVSPQSGPRSIGSRFEKRVSPTTAAFRDNGLLAWLAAKRNDSRIQPTPEVWERSSENFKPIGGFNDLENAIDLAFALLEV